MNSKSLTVLRGKLAALETGYLVGIYEPAELKQEAGDLLSQYPNMPTAERERTEALKLAVEPTKGRVS